MINLIKLELKDKIKDVRVSSRLTKSPLLLVADEEGMDINMEKIMKMHNQSLENNKKILEINPNHAMIIKISNSLSSIDHKKIANLIFDQANILDGNPVKNPSEYHIFARLLDIKLGLEGGSLIHQIKNFII